MKQFLQQIHPVKDEILEEYIDLWQEFSVPKKTVITSPGQIQRDWYFVLEGIQKGYWQEDEKEHITAFTYPPSFSGIPESFLTQTPSKYYLETITDSRFLRISYDKHEELLLKHPALNTLFRKAAELFLVGLLERYHELMAYDIETRFKTFAQRSPHLLGMIPQKDLASYLRIDPTNFSKLINKTRI